MSLIRSFNIKVAIKSYNRGGCLVQLAKASYINKIFLHSTTSVGLSEIMWPKRAKVFRK